MKSFVGFLMVFALLGGLVVARQGSASIAGKWSVTVEGEERGDHHHFPSVVMELEQDGKKVTANFMIPDHGDLPMEGEFVGGKLTLKSTEDAFMKLEMTAQLKDGGQLAGTLSGTMGNHAWTAERAKSR